MDNEEADSGEQDDILKRIERQSDLIEDRLLSSETGSKKKLLKGVHDPHFPAKIFIKPSYVSLPAVLHASFRSSVSGSGLVKLKDLSPEVLNQLSERKLKRLLVHLSRIPVRIEWYDKKGHIRSGKKHLGVRFSAWEKTNAAAALALLVGMQHERQLLTKMLTIAPDSITFGLNGDAASVVDVQVVASALVEIISQITPHNSRQIASSAENVAQIYIEYWAEEQSNRLILALTQLVLETARVMNLKKEPFTVKQKGILLGALLASALLHANEIKSEDEKRLWIVNSISNLAWAASTFMGTIPLAGSVIAAVAGSLSIAVVAWGIVYNKIGVRDFIPKIKEIEGHIEFSVLDAVHAGGNEESRLDILEALAWMRSTVHINGLSD
ncbi:MAG: hypothetical protein H6618_04230 [Deltaproteobacteria bacterium]|nr:hypothetical protein [Deltaproteobacteria bacterium]